MIVGFLVSGWLMLMPAFAQSSNQSSNNRVITLTATGAVTSAMRDYIERGISTGEEQGVDGVIIQLDTPGGQISIMLEIVQRIQQATVPIIVYVSPEGAQAASAGTFITASAHASGMAPNTVIGAASPIDGDGSDIEETLNRKITEDLNATIRNLLAHRGEKVVEVGQEMVDSARAITADEALGIGFVDVVALDVDDLLNQLDGRMVLVDNETTSLQLADAQQTDLGINTVEAVLHLLANPNVVAMLVALAIPAIIIELRSPGGWVAGFIGVMALLLSLYGFGELPVNWLGGLIIIVAFGLLAIEAFSPTVGGLGFAGTLTLIVGLLVLFNSPSSPEFARIRISTAIGVALPVAALSILIGVIAWRTQKLTPITGLEGLVGQVGEVRSAIEPRGTVLVNGELWHAISNDELAISAGKYVVVDSVDKFILTVRPKSQ